MDIKSLNINTHIGVHAWEQRILQRLFIDISIFTNFSTVNNQLSNTIDYDQLCKRVTAFVETNSFTLIETVAEQVAELIKNEFKVTQLTIRVSKPDAVKNAGDISVTIER